MVAQALVGAADDAFAYGLAFDAEGGEERRGCEVFLNVGDLPGEVVGILDAGVGAETVEGRMPAIESVSRESRRGLLVSMLTCARHRPGRRYCHHCTSLPRSR